VSQHEKTFRDLGSGFVVVWQCFFEENIICTYEKVLNKTHPCDQSVHLKQTIDSMFFDLMPIPEGVTYEEFRALINKRIQEWDSGAEKRKKEYKAERKK